METQPYLIFALHDSLYGVDALAVEEIFLLPELTPLVEAPPDIAGLINLRGDVIPVIDLSIRFGLPVSEYQLNHSLIVLKQQNFRWGMIVHQVKEVQFISHEEITSQLIDAVETPSLTKVISGVARFEQDLIYLLHIQALNQYLEYQIHLFAEPWESEAEHFPSSMVSSHWPKDSSLREIFRHRAENLMKLTIQEDVSGLKSLAVVGLDGEFFGLPLEVVREFINIEKITPIPCTPRHIVGNINLRGEIITLLDLRSVLNLALDAASQPRQSVLIQIADLVAGLVVDEVFDVLYLNPAEIMPIPVAIHGIKNEYLKGTAAYQSKVLSILNIQKILVEGELIINEEVL